MPELPEVETVRGNLAHAIGGAAVDEAVVNGRRSVRRQSAASFTATLAGRTIVDVRRRGKWLYCPLDDDRFLIIHLRMSGKLTFVPRRAPSEPHTHIVLRFADRDELRFIDPRTFGEMFVADDHDLAGGRPDEPAVLAHVGIDPYRESVDADVLHTLLSRRRTALKAFLLDQRAIAGIGNIYADEICFRARLRPDRRTELLERSDSVALAAAINEIIDQAVRCRGSSLRDESYRDLFGSLGSYQDQHTVYARTDESCVTCGQPIVRVRVPLVGSAHFCPSCQR